MNEFNPALLPGPEPECIGAAIFGDSDRPDESRYEKDWNQDNRKGHSSRRNPFAFWGKVNHFNVPVSLK
jgi:hypothetical protein